jgi:hypothetical protein
VVGVPKHLRIRANNSITTTPELDHERVMHDAIEALRQQAERFRVMGNATAPKGVAALLIAIKPRVRNRDSAYRPYAENQWSGGA